MKSIIVIFLILISFSYMYGQNEQKFSAVNPALFLYKAEDVYIRPPQKYNNGANIIVPQPNTCPWEARLENGMPNILKDNNGNLSIYISSFISYSSSPPSKVGVLVYTNSTSNINTWTRPNAGLYWYNPNGKTADEKISSTYSSGFKPTNIVAVDIESFGIYDDVETNTKPIKLIYLPQRESSNKVIAGYEMERSFTNQSILQDFSKMKQDRKTAQKKFTFNFINGDTHMNYLKQNNKYFFVSRLNAKRSSLQSGETLPFSPDNRQRFRRETITEVGSLFTSKNVDVNIALDMSDKYWEPYSMQPFRMENFGNDVWWGLVTMYGSDGVPSTEYKQRTELAISNDGFHWRYLKPGTPFLDNGTDPNSHDYGCINIGKPIVGTKFAPNSTDMYYFYAASNKRHVEGRNPGISLAIGKYGKMAGLKALQTEKTFYSLSPISSSSVTEEDMIQFSIADAFHLGNIFYPKVLADITADPRGKTLTQLNSYVAVLTHAYDASAEQGVGMVLSGVMGSSQQGTTNISDNYEAVKYTSGTIDGTSKNQMLKYLKKYSISHPSEIISIKDFTTIPVVLETKIRNATFYGLNYVSNNEANCPINITSASSFNGGNLWIYTPTFPQHSCYTENFSETKMLPNQRLPIKAETGSMAFKLTPKSGVAQQTVMQIYGNDTENYMGIYYDNKGNFIYKTVIHGIEFASITIAPPKASSFNGKDVTLTLEVVKNEDRKYGTKQYPEESVIFRVFCPNIGVNSVAQQDILWNWKHSANAITPTDSANARAFAYLTFSAFLADMKYLTIGGSNSLCNNSFLGSIYHVEVAEKLPNGSSDFWSNNTNIRSLEQAVKNESMQQELIAIRIYPQPVAKNGILYIQTNNDKYNNVYCHIYNMNGAKVMQCSIPLYGSIGQMSLNNLPSGTYVGNFTIEDKTLRQIIIIK